MARRKIYLVSPREPSGATWLINCLLELGIKTYRYSPQGMWRQEGGQWVLNPHERILRKWLPALTDHASFQFREDVEVQWTHEWFGDAHAESEVLYFVRDPRDALYSRYKREAPDLSYREFVAFPDVRTLLDKVSNWWLFNKTWLTHSRLHVCRFEDYKTDAAGTLRQALAALQLNCGDTSIAHAVRSSTFERAAAAERAYRDEQPDDAQLINRSGQPMAWLAEGVGEGTSEQIEKTCADLLAHFHYPCSSANPIPVAYANHVRRLKFFGNVLGLQEHVEPARTDAARTDASSAVLGFVASLDAALLERSRLPEHELRLLRASLREYLYGLAGDADAILEHATPKSSSADDAALRRLPRRLLGRVRRILRAGA